MLFARSSALPDVPDPFSAGTDAFAVEEPATLSSPVVFASPHSGRRYPDWFLSGCRAGLMDLRRIEDAYMDRLLVDVPQFGAPVIHGLLGRSVIDLNRAETELDPAMIKDAPIASLAPRTPRVEAGLGCLPRIAFNGVGIYGAPLAWREVVRRIEEVHRPYHRALAALLDRAQAMFGRSLLIDCHSMPSEPDRREGGLEPDVEIVLGDRFGAACSERVTARVEDLFRQKGYRTARNAPYAGGYATILHGRPASNRLALQIEIRRDLYLDELRVEPGSGFTRMRQDLADIAQMICREANSAVDGSMS